MVPVKVHTYVFNLSEPNPVWRWDHEMTELYGMKDLSPKSFDELNDKLLSNEEIAVKFYNAIRGGAPMSNRDSCDSTCRKGLYCE